MKRDLLHENLLCNSPRVFQHETFNFYPLNLLTGCQPLKAEAGQMVMEERLVSSFLISRVHRQHTHLETRRDACIP